MQVESRELENKEENFQKLVKDLVRLIKAQDNPPYAADHPIMKLCLQIDTILLAPQLVFFILYLNFILIKFIKKKIKKIFFEKRQREIAQVEVSQMKSHQHYQQNQREDHS